MQLQIVPSWESRKCEHWDVYLILDQSKRDLLPHSDSSPQGHWPADCRKKKKISQSIFYQNTELKWKVCHPTCTHECVHHSGFPVNQVVMTSSDCDTILEVLRLWVFCWLCAHIWYRNLSLLNHFYSQMPTNYLMDVQLFKHAIEYHLFLFS